MILAIGLTGALLSVAGLVFLSLGADSPKPEALKDRQRPSRNCPSAARSPSGRNCSMPGSGFGGHL